jgi:hypothetical protein
MRFASFKDSYCHIGILGEPCCQREAGGAATDDYIVVRLGRDFICDC